MSSQVTERNARKVMEVLEGLDRTFGELQRSTDLGEHECERAVNYLKAQGRIENRQGLLHLRPAVTEESSDAPAEVDAPPLGESVIATTEFDYAALDKDTAAFVQGQTAIIKRLYQGTVRNIVHIGEALLDVREKLVFGEFGAWLAAEFGMSERSARNYMNAARAVQNGNVAELNLPMSALYLLGAPSVPDEVRDDVIARAESGEQLTVAAVKEAIADAKPKAEPEAVPAAQESPAPADDPHNPEADKTSLRILLRNADGSLHRMVLMRQALDAGLRGHQALRALHSLIESGEVRMDGLICVLVPAESETPVAPPPTLDARATIRVLLAGEPVKRADLWRQFALNTHTPDLYDVLREMVLAGEVIVSDVGGTYTLATAAPVAEDSAPGEMVSDAPVPEPHRDTPAGRGLPMTVEIAKGLIVDALRNSQRWLTEGELQKYANIRREHDAEFAEAMRQLLNKQVLQSIKTPQNGTRYHIWGFPLPSEPAPTSDSASSEMPAVSESAHLINDNRRLIEALYALRRTVKEVREFEDLSAWSGLPRELLDGTHELLKQTHDDLTGLQDHLAALGAQIKLALPENQAAADAAPVMSSETSD